MGPTGFEPVTSSLSGMRSNRAELWALLRRRSLATPAFAGFGVVDRRARRYTTPPHGDVAQPGRAPGLQPGGRGFKSHRLHARRRPAAVREAMKRKPSNRIGGWWGEGSNPIVSTVNAAWSVPPVTASGSD